MYRRLLAALSSLLLLGSLISPAGAEPGRRVVEGSFTATAKPLPSPWMLGPASGCEAGVEGIHKVSHPLVAPFGGWLRVELTFGGEWDLLLYDPSGGFLATSGHQESEAESVERLDYYLEKGQEVLIVACNFLSETDAEATYKLTEGPAWRSGAGGKRISRVTSLPYQAPAIATPDVWGICHVGMDVGCTAMYPRSTDRYVSAKVIDDVSPEVSFEIYQISGNTYLGSQFFCSSTEGRVPVKPGTDFLGVTVFLGPCRDGTPATPTKGSVRLRFTNL